MRGQASLEFIIIFSTAILMMASLFIVGAARLEHAADEKHLQELYDIALTAQQELITATTVHDGYERTFYLPESIGNTPYVFLVQNTTAVAVVTVQWKNLGQSVRVPLHNGTLQPGRNVLQKMNGSIWCNP